MSKLSFYNYIIPYEKVVSGHNMCKLSVDISHTIRSVNC